MPNLAHATAAKEEKRLRPRTRRGDFAMGSERFYPRRRRCAGFVFIPRSGI